MTWVHSSNREKGKSVITNYLPLRLLARTAFLSVSGIALNAASASSRVNCACLTTEMVNSPLQIEHLQVTPSPERWTGAVPQVGQKIILFGVRLMYVQEISDLAYNHLGFAILTLNLIVWLHRFFCKFAMKSSTVYALPLCFVQLKEMLL